MSLTLQNVSRVVDGETWLSDVTMTLEPGSFNVLLGRTLAGKTSLMRTMSRLARAKVFANYAPILNEPRDEQYWLDQPGAPKPALENEKPQGKTKPYDQMMEEWMAN